MEKKQKFLMKRLNIECENTKLYGLIVLGVTNELKFDAIIMTSNGCILYLNETLCLSPQMKFLILFRHVLILHVHSELYHELFFKNKHHYQIMKNLFFWKSIRLKEFIHFHFAIGCWHKTKKNIANAIVKVEKK